MSSVVSFCEGVSPFSRYQFWGLKCFSSLNLLLSRSGCKARSVCKKEQTDLIQLYIFLAYLSAWDILNSHTLLKN